MTLRHWETTIIKRENHRMQLHIKFVDNICYILSDKSAGFVLVEKWKSLQAAPLLCLQLFLYFGIQ